MTHPSDPKKFHVLILAAGTGQRFGKDTPKQYEMLNGVPVLRRALNIFLSHPRLASLHVVIHADHKRLFHNVAHDLNLPPPTLGGKTRKESCYNGLKEISGLSHDDFILVHDAARPFLSHTDINNLLEALETSASTTLGTPIPETIIRADAEQIIYDSVDRKDCWALQTPQGFHYGPFLKAHETFQDSQNFTDDCGVMNAAGYKTKIVKRRSPNTKITWPEDINTAEKIMMQQTIPLVGLGFDVHAFGDSTVTHIRLGGIDVPHTRALMAHSDGDVVLHALTDAMLGAIGAGDIGLHFPPSDPKWAGQDSSFFLLEAHKLLIAKGASINNIDLTIICEEPKLTSVRDLMRTHIASLLTLKPAWVNVKATTTEKLGFTGRKEGIACQAIVSVSCYNHEITE